MSLQQKAWEIHWDESVKKTVSINCEGHFNAGWDARQKQVDAAVKKVDLYTQNIINEWDALWVNGQRGIQLIEAKKELMALKRFIKEEFGTK